MNTKDENILLISVEEIAFICMVEENKIREWIDKKGFPQRKEYLYFPEVIPILITGGQEYLDKFLSRYPFYRHLMKILPDISPVKELYSEISNYKTIVKELKSLIRQQDILLKQQTKLIKDFSLPLDIQQAWQNTPSPLS